LPKWEEQKVIYGKRIFPSGTPILKEWTFKKDYSFKNEIEFILNKIKFSTPFSKKINNEGFETFKELERIK